MMMDDSFSMEVRVEGLTYWTTESEKKSILKVNHNSFITCITHFCVRVCYNRCISEYEDPSHYDEKLFITRRKVSFGV